MFELSEVKCILAILSFHFLPTYILQTLSSVRVLNDLLTIQELQDNKILGFLMR